ncbi:MAG: cellulase family glycosylhydrolase [Candidatus Melainabacteria bacterium]|nr:cellulase family glycosylhydrolase [Candidatus Melainabacteria bacterium]
MENKNTQVKSKLTVVRRVVLLALVAAAFLFQLSDRKLFVAPLSFDPSKFTAGINYPWNHYGRDFGANGWGHSGVSEPKESARVEADFQTMQDHGVQITRWFVFGDARSGIKTSADGTPIGLDEQVFADFDRAVGIARSHKIYVIFVLFDYLLVERASAKDGVTMGGRRDWIVDARKRKALIENVITPLMTRYGKEPIVAAWEVMNEPEWAMRIRLKNKPHQVRVAEMQKFVSEIVQAIHEHSDRPATVGSASPRYIKYWRKAGLDLYQYHYYPRLEGRLYPSSQYSHAALALDKPLILGEFPTQAPFTQPLDYLDSALANGCAGALGWSLRATDAYSDAQKGLTASKSWSSKHSPASKTTPPNGIPSASPPNGTPKDSTPAPGDAPLSRIGNILEPVHGYQRPR